MPKIAIFIADGMADYKIKELGNKTPLEAAHKPNLDKLARQGIGGLLKTIPDNMGAGSDVANMSILGYAPEKYYTGRGPIEAGGLGIKLKESDVAFRCNLITEQSGRIHDYSGGHVTTGEARELIKTLNRELGKLGKFYASVSYRNLFITKLGAGLISTPPHDALGEKISSCLLKPGKNSKEEKRDAKLLNQLMLESKEILENHSINKKRISKKKLPANMIWLWGQGKKPRFENFRRLHGLSGAVISAVDIIRGMAKLAGMDIIKVPGITGHYDTNYEGKGKYAAKALSKYDFIYVHVEAIDEASHAGDMEMKIKTIEEFDRRLLGKFLDSLNKEQEDCIIAVLPDHFTPISMRTHARDPVPYVISSKALRKKDSLAKYTEEEIKSKGSLGVKRGEELIRLLQRL